MFCICGIQNCTIRFRTINNIITFFFYVALQTVHVLMERFDLEDSTDCLSDRLSLYDGISAFGTHLIDLCGNRTAYTINITSSHLFLQLETNMEVQKNGFKIWYDWRKYLSLLISC